MGFLVAADYSAQIRNEVMAVLKQPEGSLNLAEQMAQAEIESYLRAADYNVTAIFSATGTSRNAKIIMVMVDLVIYHLQSHLVTRLMSTNRQKRYDDVLTWLTKVSKNEVDPNLPKLV